MDSNNQAESVEVPCLGQSFQLGMLYNCHKDQLVGGKCLWNSETLKQATECMPRKSSKECKILEKNTIVAKAELLKIRHDLLLSFMAGFVTVKGSARFLHDELDTRKIQRVALFLQCMNRSDNLQMKKLGTFPSSSDLVKDGEATHIVTRITFGVSAFFVFDKISPNVLDPKAADEVRVKMDGLIKTILKKDATDAEKAEILDLKCTLYSSMTLQKNPRTWDEAVKAYEELTESAMLVPIYAQLEPLSKYNNQLGSFPVSLIGNTVATEFVKMLEHLLTAKLNAIYLLEHHKVCSYFEGLGKQLTQFQQLLNAYTLKSVKFLQEKLPKVRSGILKEDEISHFLMVTNTSPFGAAHLHSWIGEKKKEIGHLTGAIQGLQDVVLVFDTDKLDDVIYSTDYDYVLCLTISIEDQDSSLIGMSNYLSDNTSRCEPKTPWYKDTEMLKHQRRIIRHFTEFVKANRESKHLKCIASSNSKESKHCVKVICYECGDPQDFLPPGPPSKLEAPNITHNSVELIWEEPGIGATSVESYCVSYCRSEQDDQWNEFHSQGTSPCLKLDNLQPATCYKVKVKAVCAKGCSQESDTKTFKTVALYQNLPKPVVSSVTATSVLLTWVEYDKNVMYYLVTSQNRSSSTSEWKICATTQHEKAQNSITVNGLIPSTMYVFKVEAICQDGTRARSEISEVCKTKCEISFEKPRAVNITDCSILLLWASPQRSTGDIEDYTMSTDHECASIDVKSYSILYSLCHDPLKPFDWTKVPENLTRSVQEFEISVLDCNSVYVFKVRAIFQDGSFADSKISDQVRTMKRIEIQPPVVSNVTSDSALLKWMKPDKVDINQYSILVMNLSEGSSEWCPFSTCNSSQEDTKITALKPNTEYVFRVDAVTKLQGRIIQSKTSTKFRTKYLLHFSKPIALKVTCHTVRLTWSKPEGTTENVHEYIVEYSLLSNSTETWNTFPEVVNGTITNITITGLCTDSAYVFRVKAVFASANFATSDVSDKVLTKPYFLKKPCISSTTETSVNLRWSKPEESDVSQYSVMYQSHLDSPETWHPNNDTIAGYKEQVTITDLNPGTQYNFKIIAICKDGIKIESEPSACETQRSVKLARPKAFKEKEKEIVLSWTKPRDDEAIKIEGYYIAFSPDSTHNEEWTKTPLVNIKGHTTICGLKAYTAYNFKVIAKLKSGREIESPCSGFIRTKPPSKLVKPTISSLSDQSALLSWSKPEGVTIDRYTVHFQMHGILFSALRGWTKCGEVQGTEETFTAENLNSETGYYFKVFAFYEGEKKIESETSDCSYTKRTLTLSRPMIVNVTDHSVSLQWSKPDGADEEYKVQKYSAKYCSLKNSGTKLETLNISKNDLSTTVFSLDHDTEYEFYITAAMSAGYVITSVASDPIKTKPPCRPGPPIARADIITDDCIHVSWEKPSSCEETVKSYSVVYWKANEGPCTQESLNCSSTEKEKMVEGLEPQTKYIFKIRANRNEGISYESAEKIYETEPSIGVSDLGLEICTDYTATISWSRPDAIACIKCFEVAYTPQVSHSQKQMEWIQVKTTEAEQMSIKLTDLFPATTYKYIVYAVLKTGKRGKKSSNGNFKTANSCRTGKPMPLTVTNDCITIKWEKPLHHCDRVRAYKVFYQAVTDDNTIWKTIEIDSAMDTATIRRLRGGKFYWFKVKPVTDDSDLGILSERSEPIETKPECRPGKPEILTVRDTTVQLRWSAPEYDAIEVEHYEVYYMQKMDSEQKWKAFKELVLYQKQRMITITGLKPKTEYVFKVHVVSRGNLVCVDSDYSDPTTTKTEPPAKKLLPMCGNPVRKQPPAIYQLPMTVVPLGGSKELRTYEIGKPDKKQPNLEERVLMLVGHTGAGKTTLINGITNYILGVSWVHDFRFRLIGDEGKLPKSQSQTQSVTAYRFHKMEGSYLDYTLTIIDTPGFGDTRGLAQDKRTIKQIEEFFSQKGGVKKLNGIGIVTEACLSRLTATQTYIYNTVLGIFGNDVDKIISLMVTFADGNSPPVYEAIKEAKLPIDEKKYTFNNSGWYSSQENAPFFFTMGVESFRKFFLQFEKATEVKLKLTKEVMVERNNLEVTMSNLQFQVQKVLAKMDELRQTEQALSVHRTEIEQNKDFTYTVEEATMVAVDIPPGTYVTNCTTCSTTCHDNCIYSKDEDKHKCYAMDGGGIVNASCRICPKKCHWKLHICNSYKFDLQKTTVVKTAKDVETKYKTAKSNVSKYEGIVRKVQGEHEACQQDAHNLVMEVKKCIDRISAIALKPIVLTGEEYIELLIEAEKQEKKYRWEQRVKSYKSLKDRERMLQNISKGVKVV